MRSFLAMLAVATSVSALAQDRAPVDAALLVAPVEGDPFAITEIGRLSVSVGHHFPRSEAAQRLGYLLDYWKKRFNIDSEWRGDRVFLSGTVYGIKIQAMFAISDAGVVGFARDPGWPWRGQVMHYVDGKLRKYLNPTYDDP